MFYFSEQTPIFFIKAGCLIVLIFVSGFFIRDELVTFVDLWYTQPADSISVKPLRRGPTYQALAKDAVIYSSQEEVLKKRDELVSDHATFFFVNLSDMALEYYKEGEMVQSYEVKAKGEEGSFSETPNGFYHIQLKEQKHFSRIHKVWMPWSMHFFGNYFIHGWPYLANGAPVRSTTSGGCIRLLTKDAAELYANVKAGTAVLVYTGKESRSSQFTYFKRIPPKHEMAPVPFISAQGILASDLDTGHILFEREKQTVFPIASVTKLMTALVASEAINDAKFLTLSRTLLNRYQDAAGFSAGDRFKVAELFYPLLLSSSDAVAELLRREVWKFTDLMNEKARAIGLLDTKFVDASGLGVENASTPEDLFRLLHFVYVNKRPLFDLSGLTSYLLTANNGGGKYVLENMNWPAEDDFIGGKAGQAPDGQEIFAGAFRIKLSEYGERNIAIILLGSRDHVRDGRALKDYLEGHFVYGNILGIFKKPPQTVRAGANLFEALQSFFQ